MIRKIGLLFMLILTILAVTGCWNRRELNDIAIVVAIGIDKAGDKYKISTQIVNPGEVAAKKSAGGKGAPVVTYSVTSDTVFEAFRKMTTRSPRKLFFSHLRMLVLGEQLAREGIGKTLDLLSRDHEFRTDFFVVVAKNETAEKMLTIYTVPQEIIPANKMHKSLETSSKVWASTAIITIDELISDMVSEGKQPVLTGVDLTGQKEREETQTEENVKKIKPITSLNFIGMAVFKHDKLIGWINEEESKAYNYVHNKVEHTVEKISLPNGEKLALEVLRTKSEVKGNIVNGKPEISVELHSEDNVGDVEGELDLTKAETINELETLANKQLKKTIEKIINKAQKKYKADIFGFGEAMYRAAPKEWTKMKTEWDQDFVELPVHVMVDVKIRRTGTVTDSFLNKLKE